MLRAEATADGVVAVGRPRPSVAVDATDWWTGNTPDQSDEGTPEIHGRIDDSVTGRATAIRLPPGPTSVTRHGTDETWELTGERSLPSGTYEVGVESAVGVRVAFAAAATVGFDGERTTLSFPAATAVRVGFAETSNDPPGTITVPRNVTGAAAALSVLSATNLTTTAARSHSRMRRHPPLVEFDDETRIPDRIERRRPDTGVTFTLPPALDYLFPAASLAHYLGADVRIETGTTPTLSTPDVVRRFEAMPGFQYETASLLRRVFLLDCLVRGALPGNEAVAESRLLDRLPIDPERVADSPLAERVETYLDTPFDLVSPDLPEWHLSMYVEPSYEHVRTLPHVVSNLPNVFLPDSQPLGSNERLARSLDDFYRDADRESPRVEPIKPLLGPGRVHGWLADGIPIDVFKSLPEAYEHRTRGSRSDRPTSVVAVLNDVEMSSEHDDAADIYRRGTADLDIEVSVRERLDREELAAVFEGNHDFVHYIGHCEEAGLRCRDGTLSTADLTRSGTETFFLNACGSYYEGIDLITKGSVAGAVTFEKVLDGHAARVGTTFVRLLVNGFSIERALDLARRRIIMGTDYTVVGDGTHRLSGVPEAVPLAASITPDDGERYRIRFDASSPRVTGDVFYPPEPFDEPPRLFGAESERLLTPSETERFVRSVDLPIIFDGDIHWSSDLEGRLSI
jgi:hypothetical protein